MRQVSSQFGQIQPKIESQQQVIKEMINKVDSSQTQLLKTQKSYIEEKKHEREEGLKRAQTQAAERAKAMAPEEFKKMQTSLEGSSAIDKVS